MSENAKTPYSKISIGNVQFAAHRVSKLWEAGSPQGIKLACHRCNVKKCVRPSHLYWGSYTENLQDRNRTEKDFYSKQSCENHPRARLSRREAKRIWKRYHFSGDRVAKIVKDFNVSRGAVDSIIKGRNWARATQSLGRPKSLDGYARGEDCGRSVLNVKSVADIRKQHRSGATLLTIGTRYGVTPQCIFAIVKRRTWKHVP